MTDSKDELIKLNPVSPDPKDDWYKNTFITCACRSNEHLIRLDYFEPIDLDPIEVFLTVHLVNEPSFFKRVLTAVKYIFGYRSKYGDWDEIILGNRELQKLKMFINESENNYEKKICEFLDKNSKFDTGTKQPLSEENTQL